MTYEKNGLYIDEAHLESYAENFARGMQPGGRTGGKRAAAELRQDLRELESLHDALSFKWSGIPATPGAVRWLLDNFYLARREGALAAAELEKADNLRFAGGGFVLLQLCEALRRSGLSEITEERMALFLRGFQRELILERDELSLLPSGMKAVIVRSLLRLYRTVEAEEDRPEAGNDAEAEADAAKLFTALRWFGAADLRALLEDADCVEQTLRRDPAGVYPRMAEASRAFYRRRLSSIALKRNLPEHKAAQRVLNLAGESDGIRAHVGWWILNAPLGAAPKQRRGGLYIASNTLLTLFFSLLAGFFTRSIAVFALLLIPVSELVKSVLDFALLHTVKPTHVPRFALKDGVPAEGRTLCVISALLTDEKGGAALARRLEESRLLSRDAGKELRFAILADLPDSPDEVYPKQKEIFAAAANAVEALNQKYGGGFYLLTRPRVKTPDGTFCGWERKRGALLETMRFLRGEKNSMTVAAGDADALKGTKYLLALDSDTRFSPGAARELIGAMLHPLNMPVVDETRGIVRAGYGILAPRIGTELSAAGKMDFSRVFAGQGGTDPYGGACSDLSMDLWRQGGFAGKGILDIDAYLACMGERVPENRMLSHDAVEGAFLRSGFAGDVELIDGWPGNVLSYFARLERWTRGDWQNIVYLFRPGKALPDVERWKLFDSLRRSLFPVMTTAALLFGFFRTNLGLTAAAALLALMSELLLTMAEAMLRREGERAARFHSALFVGVGGGLVRTLLRLLLLPAEAWVCLSALGKALWRLMVSKKRLLEWRTAAQSERVKSGLVRYYLTLWFPPFAGILLLAFAPSIIGKAAGVLWLLTPLCALLLSLPARAPLRLNAAERDVLLAYAKDTFVFFDRFLTPEDHFLPPDNYQVQPPVGLARRTSPTNIGLGLLSVLAAADLRFCEPERAMALIEHCLASVEALPKWNGHLYNWYNTETRAPLSPRYVSTVDSGNLCACLIALRSGLTEYGREDLAARVGKLIDAMGFGPLFDRKRKLFYIGVDAEQNMPTESWYDLMSSEARLTGYLAVARGDVPKEHWRRLSRAQVASGLYRGMASWTGTMFEYLMPELLLPLQPDSLLYESAKFCLYVQRKRVRGLGESRPWGISESAFGALDPSMNYRYKAHGCAGLALKRGMDDELVVSPYSSFLALSVEPHAALRNLQKLEQCGMRCEYGFWEAIDFTSSRVYEKQPAIVRCVMAHHQGMSLVAAANLLTDGVMQRRFLADPAMGAYLGLVQEKVPLGGGVLRRSAAKPEPAKPPRVSQDGWTSEGAGTDFLLPRCCLLASRTYQLLCAETGLTSALWGAVSPYVPPRSPLNTEKGLDFFLTLGGRTVSLLPDARAPKDADYSWSFATDRADVAAVGGAFSSHVLTTLSDSEIGERREVRLSHTGTDKTPAEAALTLRFRPLLAKYNDYVNHPAFYGLGLSAKLRSGCLLLRRLSRGETRELWMCLAPGQPCAFDLSPGAASGRASRTEPATETERFLTDPLVTAEIALELAPGEPKTVSFALAMAYTEADALQSALRILDDGEAADLPQTAATVIGMEPEDVGRAFVMLPSLCFPPAAEKPVRREALWRFGISGDLPIVCADVPDAGEQRLDWARKLMDYHLFLSGCGADFDLVFLCRDSAGYQKPLQSALSNVLWRSGGEVLRDCKGGVHILEDGPDADAIRSAAVLRPAPGSLPAPESRRADYRAFLPVPHPLPMQDAVRCDWGENGEFQFYVNRSLPPRAWQQLLTNGRFGCLATDCGSGNLWYLNARENQITPWLCQPSATTGPERLLLRAGGELRSLFAAPADTLCRVAYRPGAAVWETKFPGGTLLRTTAFVPPNADARVLLIESVGGSPLPEDAELHWQLDLLLSGSPGDARYCRTAQGGGFLAAENPRAMAHAKPFLAMATDQIAHYTFDRASALALAYDTKEPEGAPVFAAKLPLRQKTALVCGCDAPEKLLALTRPGAAEAALAHTTAYWDGLLRRFSLRSPDLALDRLMNGWIGYQALACRLLGRCSLYQSGGAYGFRDQLQDAVNLILLEPALAREQILRCCARQYAEGDVQHWWHEGGDTVRGVRTHCSDDLLWLPWALCEYVEKTGDARLCAEEAPYLFSPPLRENERDRYEAAVPTEQRESVLEHCRRAIALVMARGTGPHGLLWIGNGDWNDGFSKVGGESVWLSWFFLWTADRFAALLERQGADASELRAFADTLAEAANAAWDGEWYLRGYYADGAPLGSGKNAECRIDSIAQSFAALSGRGEPDKVDRALDAAVERLFDREHGIIKLFDPPFAGREHPGYIESYGPGFRENGGQYTHGAVWLVMALLKTGKTDTAWELLRALLPADKDPAVYKAEPFVLAADVYAAAGHEGEGGWSWYTGAAGWLLRVVAEELLGLRLRDGQLSVAPNLPSHWSGYSAVCRDQRVEVSGDQVRVNGRVPAGGVKTQPFVSARHKM